MSVPETMTAAYITWPGPADEIRIGRFPVPEPGSSEVLVRVRALAVNHVDTFVRSGAYRTRLPYPFVIGRDLVGTVITAAPGFAPGDTVWCDSLGFDGRQGSFSDYAVVPADRLYHLPAGVDPENAVACLHTAATAHIGLFREAGLRIGETVVVTGAGGGVGTATVQLAAAAGARVVATARPDDFDWCRRCGADEVVDYRDPGVYGKIAELAPGGVDVFWDNAGRHHLERTVPLLARGGRMIILAGLGATPVLPVGQLYTRDASLRGFAISNATVAELATAATAINHLLARGTLVSRIGTRLPLTEAARSHRLQEGTEPHHPRGRIVVLP
ncbi:NADPH:quinone reductase [Streptosporangium sp. OZ121]|uniref:NADPH:quinone reductase n=1 Tax=Streptosporangium sp. OZ121 TaxID=3444183 RepID=UPI003F7A677F